MERPYVRIVRDVPVGFIVGPLDPWAEYLGKVSLLLHAEIGRRGRVPSGR